MQRIQTLLDKISELSKNESKTDFIEIDLMLDYTKVLYADLLEWRNKVSFTSSLDSTVQTPTNKQPDVTTIEVKDEASIPQDNPILTNTEQSTPEEVTIPKYNHQPERKNINKHIGINDKYQYISELFGNDKVRYEEVLNKINTFDESEAAINWLQTEIKSEQNWNDDIESVQMFYDTVNSFFSSM